MVFPQDNMLVPLDVEHFDCYAHEVYKKQPDGISFFIKGKMRK